MTLRVYIVDPSHLDLVLERPDIDKEIRNFIKTGPLYLKKKINLDGRFFDSEDRNALRYDLRRFGVGDYANGNSFSTKPVEYMPGDLVAFYRMSTSSGNYSVAIPGTLIFSRRERKRFPDLEILNLRQVSDPEQKYLKELVRKSGYQEEPIFFN